MCDTCGCGHVESFKIIPVQGKSHAHAHEHSHEHAHEHVDEHGNRYTHVHVQEHAHAHPHEHSHGHPHEHTASKTVDVHTPLLIKNDRLAEQNRGFLKAKGIFAINLVSSPGTGKTTFLAKTLEMIDVPSAVIVGDLETANDAMRLRDKGAPVVQVTTGTVCHLDAEMIAHGMEALDLAGRRLLFIENVGNLVCPASFDLGEAARVALVSVTEGEDKPLKYPPIFRGAHAIVITKTDLLQACGIDIATLRRNLHTVSPNALIFEVSSRTGEGMQKWLEWLRGRAK